MPGAQLQIKGVIPPSPFLSMLRTTVYPSTAEAHEIREIVQRQATYLDQLTVEISRAQVVVDQLSHESQPTLQHIEARGLLDHLQQKHDEAYTSLEAHRSLLSPIRRLFPEVLAEIFMCCLPPEQYITPTTQQAPMLLTQVSAVWRSIALSTPRLWSSLQMDHRCADRNFSSLAELWLSRTAICPLSLSVSEEAALDSFRYLLRWQHVRLDLPYQQCQPFDIAQLHAPLLETLEFRTHQGADENLRQFFGVLLSAPRLQEVTWYHHGRYSLIQLPWMQLTSLTISAGLSACECLRILEQSQNLAHAAFYNIIILEPLVPRDTILVRQLSSLALGPGQNLSFILDHLVLPLLSHIEINTGLLPNSTWFQSSFLSFISRSSCSLENLGLFYVPISEAELIECLQRTNASLVELTVHGLGDAIVTNNIIQLLTNVHSSCGQPVCLSPNMEILALYACTACSEGALADMVESRLDIPMDGSAFPSKVKRMKVVEIFDDQRDIARLKDLRNKGLVVKVYSCVTMELMESE